MPHIIIKLWPGRAEEQKKKLTKEITESIEKTLDSPKKMISVSFEEISSRDWTEKVYKPDIIEKENTLYKKPGYDPSDYES